MHYLARLALPALLLVSIVSFAQDKQAITLEEIWSDFAFSSAPFRAVRSMNDGLHYSKIDEENGVDNINQYSYKTGLKVSTVVNGADLVPEGEDKPISIVDYSFSADETKVIIASESQQIYRRSSMEKNYVFDIATKKFELLSEGMQGYATFSPNGSRVAFVRENNLFVKDLASGKERQITNSGEMNAVINGSADWVYEEEFAFAKAFFWSPDGKRIAYYKFDERKVPEFSMDMYGGLYPEQYRFKYPKAGEDNAKVNIKIYNVENGASIKLSLGMFEYIPRIKWTSSPDKLAILRSNRHQNKIDLLVCDANTGKMTSLLTEKNDTYVDINDNLTFLADGEHFIWTSEKDGYNHIYLHNMSGDVVAQLTKGAWDVIEYLGFDEKSKLVYYISAEASPMQRNLYSVNLKGTKKLRMTPNAGWNSATFSKGFKYYINSHTSANTPAKITLHDSKGKLIRELENNERLRNKMASKNIKPAEFFDFTTSENVKLNGWMIKPPNFDASKKYPVMMYVYGGPGAQTVKDSWGGTNYFWHQMLAQNGYIVVSVDNRGTGARGYEFKNCTYKQLGKYETMDQIEAAKWLQKQPYVDGGRIGIWGWSYGGFMSTLCITKGADVFNLAIAVAPVSNWRYYDSIYTERYMQTPQENASGYDDNSPINHVDKLKGKYMLVHGMADDNVHFQNAVDLSEALIRANKQFEYMAYPNRNHGIYGQNARLHLYTKMTDFILGNL